MDQIDKYKKVQEDQQLGKGKAKIIPQERRDFRSDRFNNNNRPRKDYAEQSKSANMQAVNAVFQDPIHQVMEKIKNKPFFKWPNKMEGHLLKTSYRHDKCHSCRPRKDQLLSF